ncbi:MAG: response regulator [Ignavibacteriales bacterium]|nr:response regulator [Ignavibacteriales bacterium]
MPAELISKPPDNEGITLTLSLADIEWLNNEQAKIFLSQSVPECVAELMRNVHEICSLTVFVLFSFCEDTSGMVCETVSGISAGEAELLKKQIPITGSPGEFPGGNIILQLYERDDYCCIPVLLGGKLGGCMVLLSSEKQCQTVKQSALLGFLVNAALLRISQIRDRIPQLPDSMSDVKAEMYRKMLDTISIPFAVYDTNLNYAFVNGAYIHHEPSRKAVIGNNDSFLIIQTGLSEESAHRRLDLLKEVLKLKRSVTFEESFVDEAGNVRSFFRTFSPLTDEKNDLKMIISYGLDVTAFKKAQESLFNSERQLSFVLNTVAEGIIMFNNENLIILANREAEKIWGYPPGKLVGSYIHKLMEETENAPPALINFLLNPTSNSEIMGHELEFVGFRKDRRRFPVAAKIQETIIGDKHYYTAALSDITERKMFLEQLMHAKDEAEKSSRVKEEFLAHISHEIRTPLNSIFGLTELLLQMQPQDEQLAYLQAIKLSSDTLLLLINDVLDISKIQSGKVQLQDYSFSLHDIFFYIQGMMQAQADEKRITLSHDIETDIPDLFYGDAVRLSQIVLNLVSNAVKFTEQGSVLFSAALVKRFAASCEVLIQVKDTGIGIPQEQQQIIFESFTQITTIKQKQGRGSGLGLSISRALARLFGGDITVKSASGNGSTFSCCLFLKTKQEDGKIYKSFRQFDSCTADLSNVKVMIVEDNVLNVLVIQKMLKRCHAEVVVARNGAEAIELLKQSFFDVILMDISMPLMNGFEASERIRTQFTEPKKNTPIIALTASSISSGSREYRQSGMNDYLAKPFLMVDLVSKIIYLTGKGTLSKGLAFDTKIDGESPIETGYNLHYLHETFGENLNLIAGFIEKYLDQSEESLSQLEIKLKQHSFEEASRIAHKIKSGSTYIGAHGFAELVESIENGEYNNLTEDETNAALALIYKKFQQLKEELSAYLERGRK